MADVRLGDFKGERDGTYGTHGYYQRPDGSKYWRVESTYTPGGADDPNRPGTEPAPAPTPSLPAPPAFTGNPNEFLPFNQWVQTQPEANRAFLTSQGPEWAARHGFKGPGSGFSGQGPSGPVNNTASPGGGPTPAPSPTPGPAPAAAQTPQQLWQAAGIGQGAYSGEARTVNGVTLQPGDNVVFDNGQVRVFRGGNAQPVATQRPGDAPVPVSTGGSPATGGTPSPAAPATSPTTVGQLPVEAYQALSLQMSRAAAAAVAESQQRGIIMQPVLGPDATYSFEPVLGPNGQPIPTTAGQLNRAQIEHLAAQSVLLQAQATGYVTDPTTGQRIQTPEGALRGAQAALTQAQSEDVRAGRLTEDARTAIQRYTAEQNVASTKRQLDLRQTEIDDARRNGDLERANRLEVQANDLRGRLQLQERELDTQLQIEAGRMGFQREQASGYLGGQATLERQRIEADISATNARIRIAETQGNADLALRERQRLDQLQTEQARLSQQESQFQRDIALRTGEATGQITTAGGQTVQTLAGKKAELDAAIARANLTGNLVDPVTGQSVQTLQAQQQRFTQAISQATTTGTFIDPETGQQQMTLEAQKAIGVVGGQATLEAQLAQANLEANPRNYLEASFLQEARGSLGGLAATNQITLPGPPPFRGPGAEQGPLDEGMVSAEAQWAEQAKGAPEVLQLQQQAEQLRAAGNEAGFQQVWEQAAEAERRAFERLRGAEGGQPSPPGGEVPPRVGPGGQPSPFQPPPGPEQGGSAYFRHRSQQEVVPAAAVEAPAAVGQALPSLYTPNGPDLVKLGQMVGLNFAPGTNPTEVLRSLQGNIQGLQAAEAKSPLLNDPAKLQQFQQAFNLLRSELTQPGSTQNLQPAVALAAAPMVGGPGSTGAPRGAGAMPGAPPSSTAPAPTGQALPSIYTPQGPDLAKLGQMAGVSFASGTTPQQALQILQSHIQSGTAAAASNPIFANPEGLAKYQQAFNLLRSELTMPGSTRNLQPVVPPPAPAVGGPGSTGAPRGVGAMPAPASAAPLGSTAPVRPAGGRVGIGRFEQEQAPGGYRAAEGGITLPQPPPFGGPSPGTPRLGGAQRGPAIPPPGGAGLERAVPPPGVAGLTYGATRQPGSVPVSAGTRALLEGTPIPKFGAIAGGAGGYVNQQELVKQFNPKNIRTADYLNLRPSEQAQTRAVASLTGRSDEDFQSELQANLPQFRAPRAGRVRAS